MNTQDLSNKGESEIKEMQNFYLTKAAEIENRIEQKEAEKQPKQQPSTEATSFRIAPWAYFG